MSVVARQSFKYSIIGYLGFLVGMVSAVFIFPSDLTYYGKLRYILPAAQMYMTVVVFGLSFSNVYFFGRLKEVNKQQNFLSWSLLLVAINFVVFTGGFFAIFYFYLNCADCASNAVNMDKNLLKTDLYLNLVSFSTSFMVSLTECLIGS